MNGRDLGDGVADAQPEHLPDVRGGVGTDQQDLLSRPGQRERSGTRNRGLAHPSFAGEEEEPGRVVQELHVLRRSQQQLAVSELAGLEQQPSTSELEEPEQQFSVPELEQQLSVSELVEPALTVDDAALSPSIVAPAGVGTAPAVTAAVTPAHSASWARSG